MFSRVMEYEKRLSFVEESISKISAVIPFVLLVGNLRVFVVLVCFYLFIFL